MVMEWPPHSPDLNPIEHLWFPFKEGAHIVNPEVDFATGSNERKDILWDALQNSWAQIKRELLRSLMEGMPCRVKAVIRAKGWLRSERSERASNSVGHSGLCVLIGWGFSF